MSVKLSLESIVSAVAEIYEAGIDSSRWKIALAKIALLFECDAGGLTAFDHKSAVMQVAVATGAYDDPALIGAYTQYFVNRDILLDFALTKPESFIYHDGAFPDQDQLRNSEIFNDFFRMCEAEVGLATFVVREEGRHGLISLRRNAQRGRITEAEVHLASVIRPHITRAFQIHRQFSALQSSQGALTATFDKLSLAVFLIDDRGHVASLNEHAERLITSADGLALVDGELACIGPDAVALQNLLDTMRHMDAGTSLQGGGTLAIRRPSGARAYSVLAAPLPMRRHEHVIGMVLIIDPDQQPLPRASRLQNCFGLTSTEAEFAVALLRKRNLTAAAYARGLTIDSARQYLKRIFAKTATNSQVELVALLSQPFLLI